MFSIRGLHHLFVECFLSNVHIVTESLQAVIQYVHMGVQYTSLYQQYKVYTCTQVYIVSSGFPAQISSFENFLFIDELKTTFHSVKLFNKMKYKIYSIPVEDILDLGLY